METEVFPIDSFIEPNGKNIKEVKILIEAVMNLVVDHAATSGSHSLFCLTLKNNYLMNFL